MKRCNYIGFVTIAHLTFDIFFDAYSTFPIHVYDVKQEYILSHGAILSFVGELLKLCGMRTAEETARTNIFFPSMSSHFFTEKLQKLFMNSWLGMWRGFLYRTFQLRPILIKFRLRLLIDEWSARKSSSISFKTIF